MRASNLSRRQAYVCFRRFRRANRRCGLGPAFFTKLIFFLNRRERGYFMDQWTGLGINLLFEPAIVDLNVVGGDRPAHVVSDGNCGGHYERFCQAIECLARRTGWPAELVEERLFCKGGQGPGPWRQYVIDHRPNGAIRVP